MNLQTVCFQQLASTLKFLHEILLAPKIEVIYDSISSGFHADQIGSDNRENRADS
jgi:hypothetical protein